MDFIKLDDIQNRLVKHLNQDIKLQSIGFNALDDYYKVILGNCTDITGYPYMGKTLLLMEILFNLSYEYGYKHLLHLPDMGKPEEVIAILLQKLTGKTFDKRYENKIDEPTILKNINWIDEHFKILSYEKRPSPIEFWEYAGTLDVQCASIDSWNYMRHDSSGTEYLASQLSTRNELAEKYNKHFFTIIHPKNPTQHDKDANGKVNAPDVYNLMGGSEWNNNGKNIIVLHKESKESMDYDIYFRKIKPRIVGKTGMETMQYDIVRQKFFTADKGTRMYAFGEKEKFDEVKNVQLNPDAGMKNFMFDKDSGDVMLDSEGREIPF